eukprot:CAMPEP_0198207952 /NCGR_PEP_ID=MMETSP1445-20131203/11369_1 /TAXON_ID=36898 /ORGANISM="Pyramimonas sp., Strain CCMP2087" /LENGTH=106 /DNA_ID=CAMNT_0043881165 /DNA_START=35 /DNA_END=352 /DNA_ORIENTATION=-
MPYVSGSTPLSAALKSGLWVLAEESTDIQTLVDLYDGNANLVELRLTNVRITYDAFLAIRDCFARVKHRLVQTTEALFIAKVLRALGVSSIPTDDALLGAFGKNVR